MKNTLFAFALTCSAVLSAQADLVLPKSPEDLFVRFETRVPESTQVLELSKRGLSIEWRSSLVPGLVRVKPQKLQKNYGFFTSATQSLALVDGVMYAEPNHRFYRKLDRSGARSAMSSTPSDPMLWKQWALQSEFGVNPTGAWEKTTGSREIKVAILDTGVQADHPELSDRLAPGYDFIDKDSDPSDSHGHGTHVSGIVGAKWDNHGIAGINSEVTLIPVRVVPDDGDETDSGLVESFEFAVQEGARIANCSFGKAESSQAVKDVIAAAGEKGLLVVVAAGNDRRDIGKRPTYPASFQTPNMIVVGATNSGGSMSFFSNYSKEFVHLSAPGSSILSSISGSDYASWDGTSMAAPQVAGVAALTLAANPSLSVAELKEILMATVTKRDSLSDYNLAGGIVNATGSVTKALE